MQKKMQNSSTDLWEGDEKQKTIDISNSSTPFFKKKFLKGYSKIHELKLVSIGLASPEKIQSWAEKELPNGQIFGEVTNANTFHYRTFQPTKGGLFCERIFGPLKDFECACGKRQKPTALESKKILEHKQTTRYFCSNCDVEYTWSIIRRYQLGYIKLNAPVTHLWYLKTNPSYLSIFFDMKRKDLEAIVYCTDSLTLENVWKNTDQKENFYNSVTDLYTMWQKFINFEETKKTFVKHFVNKKQKKVLERQKFFSFLEKERTLYLLKQRKTFEKSIGEVTSAIDGQSLKLQEEKSLSEEFGKNQRKEVSHFNSLEKSFANKSQNFFETHLTKIGVNQLNIFINILEQKQKNFYFLLLKKILKNKIKKTYGNIVLQIFSKEFFFYNQPPIGSTKSCTTVPGGEGVEVYQKLKENIFQNIFFFDSFFVTKILFGVEKKIIQKDWILFFFLLKFSNILFFGNIYLNKKEDIFSVLTLPKNYQKGHDVKVHVKKNLLLLFTIVSFLNKRKNFENFLHKKKQSKNENFFSDSFLHEPNKKLFFLFYQKKEKNFGMQNNKITNMNNIEVVFNSENFLKKSYEVFLKKKRKKFLSYSYVNLKTLSIFSNQKMNCLWEEQKKSFLFFFCLHGMRAKKTQSSALFPRRLGGTDHLAPAERVSAALYSLPPVLSTSSPKKENGEKNLKQNFFLKVSNNFVELKKKRISKKKQKKFYEFLRSGFIFETLDVPDSSNEFNTNHIIPTEGGLRKALPLLGVKGKEFEFKNRKNFSFFEQKRVFKNLSKQIILKTRNQKKKSPQKFLKNPILTICYNYIWKNDSDWKFFVYYNSLFISEFEDIPIFEQFQMPWVENNVNQNFINKGGKIKQKNFFGLPDREKQHAFFSSSFEKSQKQTQIGAGILEKLLKEYTQTELKKIIKQHQILLPKINVAVRSLKQILFPSKKDSLKIQKYIQKREHIVRRLKFLRKFSRKNSNPTFMILRNLPVLPPDLRPILKLQNQIAASDLNRFYQRIIYRNERLKKFSKDSATNQSFEIRYAQRLLQEAVDNLIQNGKGGVKPETNSRGIPLKSLSEILKGKQGRFRQYLLGKRVDYSGRSVIVVGPKLKLYECGLPKEMAFELFLPFLIQQLLHLNLSKTVVGAKNLLKKDSILAFHLLKKIMKNIPVLLNRAPTLHRLGFQAFLPKLVEGRAILLHPMVCPGFNADFDGDQMAVHVPLTVEARTEAWKFMLSTNNFINSATGDPVLLPTQDMVLGCYYLTTDFQSKSAALQILNFLRKQEKTKFYDFLKKNKNFLFFSNSKDVFSAYQRKEISLHTPIWIRWNGFVDFGNDSIKTIEIQIRKNGFIEQIKPKITTFSNQKNEIFSKFIRTTPGRIYMNFMIQEFEKTPKFLKSV